MASANTSPDIVEFDGIKYSRTDAIFEGEHGQTIYRGSYKRGTREREAAIIVFKKCGNMSEVSPDVQQTYINKNYERVLSREQDASFVRDGLACENLHRYYVETIDKQSETMYVAAEPFVCTLANLLDLEKLSKSCCVTEDETTKQKTFTDKEGRFEIVHTEKDISYFWNEQGRNYNFTISRKEIIRQIVRGLVFLHDHNIIHRNITPNNIFIAYDKLSTDSNRVLLKLSGFCLSKVRDGLIASNSGSKALGWSPREMLQDPLPKCISASVDIFSLGCVMYHVLTSGDHPFKKSERKILHKTYAPQPPELMKFSNEWFLIKRMISHNSEERPSIKEVRESPALLDKDHYVIYHTENKPGVCLIFNQENFPQSENSTRVGSSVDAKNLAETFSLFGFECFVHKDLGAKEIHKKITELSRTSGYQCIVVCVLSHGDEEGIVGADSAELTYRELREIFADSSCNKDGNCFNGQPKIFIYQSCRGDQNQLSEVETVPMPNVNLQNASDMANATADEENSKPNFNGTLNCDPALSDFLEVFSTIEGYQSYRSPNGSPFISILCERLKEKGNSEDFGSIVQLNDELQSWMGESQMHVVVGNQPCIEKFKCKQVSIKEGYGLSKCLRLEKVDTAK